MWFIWKKRKKSTNKKAYAQKDMQHYHTSETDTKGDKIVLHYIYYNCSNSNMYLLVIVYRSRYPTVFLSTACKPNLALVCGAKSHTWVWCCGGHGPTPPAPPLPLGGQSGQPHTEPCQGESCLHPGAVTKVMNRLHPHMQCYYQELVTIKHRVMEQCYNLCTSMEQEGNVRLNIVVNKINC